MGLNSEGVDANYESITAQTTCRTSARYNLTKAEIAVIEEEK